MPRLAKGSKVASERMAHLRSLRKKKGGSIDPPVVPDTATEKEDEGVQTERIRHVADFAHKNNMNYFEALKDKRVKEGYKKK